MTNVPATMIKELDQIFGEYRRRIRAMVPQEKGVVISNKLANLALVWKKRFKQIKMCISTTFQYGFAGIRVVILRCKEPA